MATQPFSRERWTLNGSSTLNAAATVNDTTITVNDSASLPTSRFSIVIDDIDIHTVTNVSANTLTVDPAISTNHAQYVTVKHVLTNRSIDDAIMECSQKLLYPKNRVLDQSGGTLTASDFTWFNQGTAACVDADDGGLNLTMPKETFHNIRGKYVTAPSTPWTLTVRCELGPGYELYAGSGVGSYMGIMARESTSNKIYMMPLQDTTLALWRMTDYSTFSANVGTPLSNINDSVWMQLNDDGTDITGSVSYDGYNFLAAWTEGRTAFMSGGVDQIGFGSSSGNGYADAMFHFKSWILE